MLETRNNEGKIRTKQLIYAILGLGYGNLSLYCF